MAIKSYLFRADEKLFDTVEQIRERLSMGTTKDTLVFLIRSGVSTICIQHGIQIKTKEEMITVPPSDFKEEVFTVPDPDHVIECNNSRNKIGDPGCVCTIIDGQVVNRNTLSPAPVFKLVDEPVESEEEVTVEEG